MNRKNLLNLLRRYWWVVGLMLALVVALLSPLASSQPDGLERVAEDEGFQDEAEPARYELLVDYLFPGIENEVLATILAGVLGTLILFALGCGLAWLLRRRAA